MLGVVAVVQKEWTLLWLAKIFFKNRLVKIFALVSSLYGRKHAIFVNRSITTKIELYSRLPDSEQSLNGGSFTIKSIAISCQGPSV